MCSIFGTVQVDNFYVGGNETVCGHTVELRTLINCISPWRRLTMELSEIRMWFRLDDVCGGPNVFVLHCVVLCFFVLFCVLFVLCRSVYCVCVCVCVLLPPGGYPIAVNKYIMYVLWDPVCNCVVIAMLHAERRSFIMCELLRNK